MWNSEIHWSDNETQSQQQIEAYCLKVVDIADYQFDNITQSQDRLDMLNIATPFMKVIRIRADINTIDIGCFDGESYQFLARCLFKKVVAAQPLTLDQVTF